MVEDPETRKWNDACVAEVPNTTALSCWAMSVDEEVDENVSEVVDPETERILDAAVHDEAETYNPTVFSAAPNTAMLPPVTADEVPIVKSEDDTPPETPKMVVVDAPVTTDPETMDMCDDAIVDCA